MGVRSFFEEPLQGKTPLTRVVWVYCVLGSVLYGALEFFLDPGNVPLLRTYAIGGLILSIYMAAATYRCAGNCRSPLTARLVRISAIASLILLPVIFYLEWTGALTLAALGGEQ